MECNFQLAEIFFKYYISLHRQIWAVTIFSKTVWVPDSNEPSRVLYWHLYTNFGALSFIFAFNPKLIPSRYFANLRNFVELRKPRTSWGKKHEMNSEKILDVDKFACLKSFHVCCLGFLTLLHSFIQIPTFVISLALPILAQCMQIPCQLQYQVMFMLDQIHQFQTWSQSNKQ